MYKQGNSEIMSLYAISPVHAGTGASMGVVDLPIQRERHTNWPHIQSSGVKGAMKHHFDFYKDDNIKDSEQIDKLTELIFGTESFNGEPLPGAISVSDAKLIAFPIRSSKKPFVWITSPSVLKRIEMDLKLTGNYIESMYKTPEPEEAYAINGILENSILLEDYEVNVNKEVNVQLNGVLKRLYSKAESLLIVNDKVYDYAVSNCIEVQTQIKINSETGVTEEGSLRYQEVLPADSIMYAVLFYGPSRDNGGESSILKTEMLIKFLKEDVLKNHIQIGGDETLGRGVFEIEWLGKEGDYVE